MIFPIFMLLFAATSFAGVTYSKSQANVSEPVEKAAAEVQRTLRDGNLSDVTARLRVEGASFRKFNLFLPPLLVPKNATRNQLTLARELRGIVERDLNIVGAFNFVQHRGAMDDALMRQKGIEGRTTLELKFINDTISASIDHKNLITGKTNTKNFSMTSASLRRLAHNLSQSIFEEYVGPEEIFTLQIAAIKRDAADSSQVVVLDFDGMNEVPLTEGPWLKSSPYFAPDGTSILYAVSTKQGQSIVEQKLGAKEFQFRIKKPGLNIDPRVTPDNSYLYATLSFENLANIYRVSRLGTVINRVTNSIGLNLSPTISADGKELAFVSDRSGTPQIYVQPLVNDKKGDGAVRATYQGRYNQTPHFSPDGKFIVFTGRDEKKVFDIFVLERSSTRISRITENQGWNQEPYFTPSGRFVIFISKRDGSLKPDIYLASLNGDHQFRLTDANKDGTSRGYFSPIISPKPIVADLRRPNTPPQAPARPSRPAPVPARLQK